MRRLLVAAFLVSAFVPSAAGATPRGVVTGHVENATTNKHQTGAIVKLSGISRSGDEIHRTAQTSTSGNYGFRNLPTGDDWLYAVDATFDGGLFPGRPFTIPSNTSRPPVIETSIRVWPTTTDPNAILVRRDDMFVVHSKTGAGIIESLTVLNQSHSAYIGRGGQNGKAAPTLGIAVPPNATIFRIENASLDVPRVLDTDFGVGLTIALPPGPTTMTFSYALEGTAGRYTLSRTALYPTVEMSVFAEPSFEVSTNRLERKGSVTLKDKDYARYSAPNGVDAGDEVQIVVTATAAVPWWAFGLGGMGLLVVVGLLIFVARRRMKRRGANVEDQLPVETVRAELVAAIATLDLNHDAGRLPDVEWETRREELKSQLEALGREHR